MEFFYFMNLFMFLFSLKEIFYPSTYPKDKINLIIEEGKPLQPMQKSEASWHFYNRLMSKCIIVSTILTSIIFQIYTKKVYKDAMLVDMAQARNNLIIFCSVTLVLFNGPILLFISRKVKEFNTKHEI